MPYPIPSTVPLRSYPPSPVIAPALDTNSYVELLDGTVAMIEAVSRRRNKPVKYRIEEQWLTEDQIKLVFVIV